MKKHLFLLTALLLTCLQGAWADDWTNYAAGSFSSINESGKTITITSATELAQLAKSVNEGNSYQGWTISLSRDLDMSQHEWMPIGKASYEFKGFFNGTGHTVSGLMVNSDISGGLFGRTEGATIVNVRIANSYIKGGFMSGTVAGALTGGGISNCQVGSDVTVDTEENAAGGLVGFAVEGASISGCVSWANVTGYTYCGGLVGYSDKLTVVHSAYMGKKVRATGGETVGAIVGHREDVTQRNVIYTDATLLTGGVADSVSDTLACRVYPNRDDLSLTFIETGSFYNAIYDVSGIKTYSNGMTIGGTFYTPGNTTVTFVPSVGSETIATVLANGTVVEQDSLGQCTVQVRGRNVGVTCTLQSQVTLNTWGSEAGSESDPYTIRDAEGWQLLADLVAGGEPFAGKYFVLAGDITADTPVGTADKPFSGRLDGNSHTLTAAISQPSQDFCAPFAYISGATISHLKVAGTVDGGIHSSGLVGKTSGTNLIEDCQVAATVTFRGNGTEDAHGGGFIGHGQDAANTLRGCAFTGRLVARGNSHGDVHAGVFVGWTKTSATLTDCVEMGGGYDGCTHLGLAWNEQKQDGADCANTFAFTDGISGGRKPYAVGTSLTEATMEFGTPAASYSTSGITSWADGNYAGFTVEGRDGHYAGEGDRVYFTIARLGYYLSDVTASSGTLTGTASPYVLTMAAADATVSASAYIDSFQLGSGTQADPYIIATTDDWVKLCDDVADGKTYEGCFFRMYRDVDANAQSVGAEGKPFSGTFDGDGHTLTFNRGVGSAHATDLNAPFISIDGATILNLTVRGSMFTDGRFAGGIVSFVEDTRASKPSALYNCHSVVDIISDLSGDGSYGGLIGLAKSGADGLSLEKCSYTGTLRGSALTNCGGLVGFSYNSVTITDCVFAPANTDLPSEGCATFVRILSGKTAAISGSYCTQSMGTRQGTMVFNKVSLPESYTYSFADEATIKIGGESYWKSGSVISIKGPAADGSRWTSPNGSFINDPWTITGRHQVRDVPGIPAFELTTAAMPEAKDEKTIDNITYRYLSRADYKLYLSDDDCADRGWYFDSGDYLVMRDKDGDENYVTAITGYKSGDMKVTLTGGWIWNSEYEGTVLLNDNVADLWEHTHLGVIAPRAFKGCTGLQRLVFCSNYDTRFRKNCNHDLDLIVGEGAFEGCTNLKEFVMMYYDLRQSDKWVVLDTLAKVRIADNAFDGTSCRIMVDQTVYQGFLNNDGWKPFWNRIGIYNPVVDDFKVNGAVYSQFRSTATGDLIENDAAGREAIMGVLRNWNANYQNFNAAGLLAPADRSNIYYTQVVGADDSYLTANDGVMRIYNDPGSYYNYKTIAIGANALKGNKNVKAIEFWQTNGRSENSYSDPKIVIENGAFEGCDNLRELRLFYYAQDGDDHWEVLGPEDVIPGDKIFGGISESELNELTENSEATVNPDELLPIPSDFKILVAPWRYNDFKEDPNWAPYAAYIQPTDYDPQNTRSDFTRDGITYGYITNPGGILQTSQTVSQDLSWWTLPRIAYEIGMYIWTFGSWYLAQSGAATLSAGAATSTARNAIRTAENSLDQAIIHQNMTTTLGEITKQLSKGLPAQQTAEVITSTANKLKGFFKILPEKPFARVVQFGWADLDGSLKLSIEQIQNLNQGDLTFLLMYTMQASGAHAKAAVADVAAKRLAVEAARKTWIAASKRLDEKVFLQSAWGAIPYQGIATTTAGLISSSAWGGPGSYNNDALKKGLRQNLLSNIHQVGSLGGGYVYTTPQKNMVYHTYVKSISSDVTEAVILAGTDKGQGANANARTMTFDKNAFRGNKTLTKISFRENNVSTNEALPMLITIPDSAFYGCDNLTELNLLLKSDHGTQALGPESFILGGDSIFAGLDSLTFHIRIDQARLQDFLDSESWAPLKRFFVLDKAEPKSEYTEYGAEYGYAYENGSVQKVHKAGGHKIEHTVAIGPDNSFLQKHSGALKLCNDIGEWNNFQLDAVGRKAFKGNDNLRRVLFTDLYGSTGFGDVYTGLDVTLLDSCFADCKNLQSLDLLYMVTDGKNHLDPIKPSQLKLGRGVLDGTTARIKMMPRQVDWFEADSTWAAYKDRFMPCVVQPADEAVRKVFKDLRYHDPAATLTDDNYWDSHIDLSEVLAKGGFTWLDNRFTDNEDLRSFPDFKYFESLGLDYVGMAWFQNCSQLTNIELPSTVRSIHTNAFRGDARLAEIELPDSLKSIYDDAFEGCTSLKTVRVRGTQPAELIGSNQFPTSSNLRIYVPDGTVDAYKTAWAPYKDNIVSEATLPDYKVVTVTAAGQLASKLGLSLGKQFNKVRYIYGNYAKYDSLTVSGPLNGEDLAVLRHLAGADAYDSDPTDGRLRYLNLWNATILKDNDNSYNGNGADEYVKADNMVPNYLFENCTAIQTVIFPKSVTSIGENIFEDATSLRQVAVGYATTAYNTDILQNLDGIEELAMLTDGFAYYDYSTFWGSTMDPWEGDIEQVYAFSTQVGNYLGDETLARRAGSIVAPFEDVAVMKALADHGHYFANEYLQRESVEDVFAGDADIHRFDDFIRFANVRSLGSTFTGCTALRTIALPDSLRSISATAFAGCYSLDTIRVSTDSVPALEAGAFGDLTPDFRIIVPKRLVRLYRERWAEYEDHIVVDKGYYAADTVITVTVTAPNTLAQALGLTTTAGGPLIGSTKCLGSVRGDYSHITKLKVIGPISGADFDLMRYMAGYCPWTQTRNTTGRLEYIDLYDANIVKSQYDVNGESSAFDGHKSELQLVRDNQLPYHAFLKAYNLKTLILPRTCNDVKRRALQECEGLENLVIGDDCADFNWDALDDDVMLTRLYILTPNKVPFSREFAVWRWLCNNYSPTFDAFYVRPSAYEDYISDPNYVGSGSSQRTSLISTGNFTDDESFRAFASHAAATDDDLATVYSVDGWFDNFPGVKDLTQLRNTSVFQLKARTLAPLTDLRAISLPATIEDIEEGTFANAPGLRYADFLLADSLFATDDLRDGGIQRLGISSKALVYVPKEYGETDEHNVIWGSDTTALYNNYLDISDGLDYVVPFAFQTKHIANDRELTGKDRKYTAVLPYALDVPAGMKAYRLKERSGSTLTFSQVTGRMEALVPYVLVLTDESAGLGTDIGQEIPTTGNAVRTMGGNQVDVTGFTLRGTLGSIDNRTAHELGAWIMQKDNQWWKVPADTEAASIPPFRCYLLENGNQGANPLATEFVDEADGIDTILTIDSDGTERYYDLSGRELPGKPRKGVYIMNGRKYVGK